MSRFASRILTVLAKVKRARRWMLLALVASVLAAGGGATAIAIETTAAIPSAPPQAGASEASGIEAAAGQAFALLRRARTAIDVIPASVPVALSGASGANLALSRGVEGAGGERAWIVPGSGSTCILAELQSAGLGGAVCTSTAAARAGELNVQAAAASSPGSELVAGLVPDGVSTVSMRLAGGAELHVAVHEGVYLSVVHGSVQAISAGGAAGPLSIPSMSAAAALGSPSRP